MAKSSAVTALPAFGGTGVTWIAPKGSLDHGGPVEPYERLEENFVERSIYDLFEVVAARNEKAFAVADGVGRLTYGQVRSAARELASQVRAAVPAGRAVAVLLPNRATSLIAALACFAAGRVCLLLNAEHSPERNRLILQRAAVAAVIVANDDGAAAALIPADAVRILAVRTSDRIVEGPWRPVAPPLCDEPAIVLYTSGSTGEPKGIVLSQAGVLWRVRNGIVGDHLNRRDRFLSLAALDTTSGMMASLSALLSGCLQLIVSVSGDGIGSLLALIREERVTILRGVPALLRMLFELDGSVDAFAHLRVVRIYGERVLWADLVKWRGISPVGCHFCIAYGQTEGYASQWFVPPARASDGALPVGYLLPGQHYAIVDDVGNSVAPGEVGELIIRSPYVALGVWEDGRCKPGGARPDASDPGFRMLSTGDLARIDGDTLLHIVGRRDRQVQIRGQRVEPAEIEDVLCRVPGVAAAAVAVGSDGERPVLFGFVVAQCPSDAQLHGRLRAALQQSLPTYMHPARTLVIDRLPLLPGGKVDTTELLALAAATPRRGGEAEPALIATQRARDAVSRAWLRTLDRSSLEADLAFDEAGGDSLRLLQFIFHLEQECRLTLPLDAFYADLRPSAFAQRLDQCLKDPHPTRSDIDRPLFLLPGVGKDEPRLVRFRAVCAPHLRIVPIDYGDWPEWIAPGFDLSAIVARIVAAIEAEAPNGPIFLGGFSMGGKIAYAVAIALLAVGRSIGFLGILDADISRDGVEPVPGVWQRFIEPVRRGQGTERLAAYVSLLLTNPLRPSQLRLAARFCRARLPGDFGFYLHWHIRRNMLAHLVEAWWAQMAPPRPQLRVPAVLFRSMQPRPNVSEDLGWREICPTVTTVAVGGRHDTMFDPPNLEPLCAHFTASALEAGNLSSARVAASAGGD